METQNPSSNEVYCDLNEPTNLIVYLNLGQIRENVKYIDEERPHKPDV